MNRVRRIVEVVIPKTLETLGSLHAFVPDFRRDKSVKGRIHRPIAAVLAVAMASFTLLRAPKQLDPRNTINRDIDAFIARVFAADVTPTCA